MEVEGLFWDREEEVFSVHNDFIYKIKVGKIRKSLWILRDTIRAWEKEKVHLRLGKVFLLTNRVSNREVEISVFRVLQVAWEELLDVSVLKVNF